MQVLRVIAVAESAHAVMSGATATNRNGIHAAHHDAASELCWLVVALLGIVDTVSH